MRRTALIICYGLCAFVNYNHLFSSTPFEKSYPLESFSTPFELVRGLIIVEAEINGESGNFILDTGSPMMILNGVPSDQSSKQANTLNGDLMGEWKKINVFTWAGIKKFNLDALSMDIGHLEFLAGKPLKGLIGYEFFGNMDLLLDFENQQLRLVPTGGTTKMDGWKLQAEIPFEMEGHLAVIEAQIGDAKFRFGLDTGAGVNLMDIGRKPEIAPELFAPVKSTNVIGLTQNSDRYQAADILETTIAGKNYWNMRYILTDISQLHNLESNNVDGLLGYPFFQSGKFTINYGKKVITIWQ